MVALRAERVSATASFLGVGIVELKTTLLNAFVVVNGCSIKKQVAFLVNDNGTPQPTRGAPSIFREATFLPSLQSKQVVTLVSQEAFSEIVLRF